MGKKMVLAFALIIAVLLVLAPLQANADQPYMGGYLKRNVVTSNMVLVDVNYQETQASQIPDGKWLGGVASVAGGDGLTPSGWIYQNGVSLKPNNDVIWAPQAWEGGSKEHWKTPIEVGEGDYVAFYERMDISSGSVVYTLYAYSDFWHYDHDVPITRTWNHSTDDGNFLIGKIYHWWHGGNYAIKHFQFGVESNSAVTNTAWEELNNHACYYDDTDWHYVEGQVCRGATAAITWNETGAPFGIGGLNYTGVNTKYTSNDMVCWKYTGTTISDDSLLWSGSGIVSDAVSTPYRVVATLEGHVSFPGRGNPPNGRWIESFDVRFFQSGNEMSWSPVSATTSSYGYFTVLGVPSGTYDIGIKNWTCLSELETGVVLSGGEITEVDFGTTREGDANNDDWVTGADRNLLYAAWGTHEGDPNWNPHCDFDRDGWITGADRNLMYTSWGQHGDLV